MRKAIAAVIFLLIAILAFYSNTRPSKAQNLPIPSVGYTVTLTQDPTHCTPGATPLNWRQDLGAMRYCSATDTWTTIGSNAGGGVTVGASTPAGSCTVGALYLRNDTSNSIQQLYVCGPTNTWQLSSYLTGTSTPTNCAAGQMFLNTSSGVISYCSAPGNPGTWTATGSAGSGTVSVVGAGSLGSGLCVTGGGTTLIQTVTGCSIDSSGNIVTAGSITSGNGSSTTGQLKLKGASSGNTVTMTVGASTAAGTFTIPGVTGTAAYSVSAGTSGHCVQYGSDGLGLSDAGAACGGAGGGATYGPPYISNGSSPYYGPLYALTPPPTTSWTTENLCSGTFAANAGTWEITGSACGATQISTSYRTAPSVPFTIDVAVINEGFDPTGPNFEAPVFGLRDSGGKYITMGIGNSYSATNVAFGAVEFWSAATTRSSYTAVLGPTPAEGAVLAMQNPMFWRMAVTSGAVQFYISLNGGLTWIPFGASQSTSSLAAISYVVFGQHNESTHALGSDLISWYQH